MIDAAPSGFVVLGKVTKRWHNSEGPRRPPGLTAVELRDPHRTYTLYLRNGYSVAASEVLHFYLGMVPEYAHPQMDLEDAAKAIQRTLPLGYLRHDFPAGIAWTAPGKPSIEVTMFSNGPAYAVELWTYEPTEKLWVYDQPCRNWIPAKRAAAVYDKTSCREQWIHLR